MSERGESPLGARAWRDDRAEPVGSTAVPSGESEFRRRSSEYLEADPFRSMRAAARHPWSATAPGPCRDLLPEAQIFDERPVSLQVCLLEVFQEPPPPADHTQEAASAVVIPFVTREVIPQVVDALSEKGNLDRCTSAVTFMKLVSLDECLAIGRVHARHGAVCCLRRSRSG